MENTEMKVVDTVEAKEVETVEEKKVDLKKIGKVVLGVGLGAAALATATWKYFTGKQGHHDLPGSDSSETAPTASESDFVE